MPLSKLIADGCQNETSPIYKHCTQYSFCSTWQKIMANIAIDYSKIYQCDTWYKLKDMQEGIPVTGIIYDDTLGGII